MGVVAVRKIVFDMGSGDHFRWFGDNDLGLD